MKLNYVAGENVKEQTFQHPLTNVTVFVGNSFSGKTAILDAIKIGLLGYHPRLLKNHKSTMDLAGAGKMGMGVTLGFGKYSKTESTYETILTKVWERKGEDEIKFTAEGDLPEIPEVLLDIEEYMEMTAAEKVMFIFQKIDLKDIGFTDQEFLDLLNTVEALPAKELPGAKGDLFKVVQESIESRDRNKKSPQIWLGDLIKYLTDEKKLYDKKAKNDAAALAALKHLGPAPKSFEKDIEAKQLAIADQEAKLNIARSQRDQSKPQQERKAILEKCVQGPAVNLQELTKQADALVEWLKDYPSTLATLEMQLTDRREKIKGIRNSQALAQKKLLDAQKSFDEIESLKECPYCKSTQEGWRNQVTQERTQAIFEAEVGLSEFTKAYEIALEEGKAIAQKVEDARAHDHNRDHVQERLNPLLLQITEASRIQTNRQIIQAELDGIASIPAPPSDEDIYVMEQALQTLETSLKGFQDAHAVFDKFKINRDKSRELEASHIQAQIRVELFKKAVALAIVEQEKLVTTAFEKILNPTRQFTSGILRGYLEYKNGRIGMVLETGAWIPHTTFSGTEKGVTFAALSVVLAQQSPVKIVIIDELGIMDPDTRVKVINRMLALTKEGFIDNFIGADVTDRDYKKVKDENFSLIKLGKTE